MRMPLSWLWRREPLPPSGFDQLDLPDAHANPWQVISFDWIWPILKVGYTRPLQEEDLWKVDEARSAARVSARLSEAFYKRCQPELRPGYVKPDDEESKTPPFAVPTSSADPEKPYLWDASSEATLDIDSDDKVESIEDPADTPLPSSYRRPSLAERLGGASLRSESTIQLHRSTSHHIGETLQRVDTAMRARHYDEDEKRGTAAEGTAADAPPDRPAPTKEYDQRLFLAICLAYKRELIGSWATGIMASGLSIGSAWITRYLIEFLVVAHDFHQANEAERASLPAPRPVGYGFGLVVGIVVAQFLEGILNNFSLILSSTAGWQARAGLSDMISEASLTLSARAKVKITQGRMNNALSTDCPSIEEGCMDIVGCFEDPFSIAGGIIALCVLLGPTALVGIACMAACVPISTWSFKLYMAAREAQLRTADARIRLSGEVVGNIRGIKLYAYEETFRRRVLQYRAKEIINIRASLIQRAILILVMSLTPVLATVATFVTYVYTGHNLDAPTVFAALQLFGFIEGPISNLVTNLVAILDALVAAKRLRDLLLAERLPRIIKHDLDTKSAIRAHGLFTYESQPGKDDDDSTDANSSSVKRWYKPWHKVEAAVEEEERLLSPQGIFKLDLAPIDIAKGDLVCVVGRVGSGKTSFVSALLGELRMLHGEITLGCEAIAYCSQRPWTQSGTVRNHILFGAEEDPAWLASCIEACALLPDLAQWREGLETELGERGITLSGGQKARLELCRALYARRPLCILDDPLSAVDAHVATHLIKKCLLAPSALGCSTRILVTHNLDILAHADMIIVLDNGKIAQKGTFQALKSARGPFRQLMKKHGRNDTVAQVDAADSKAKHLPAKECVGGESHEAGPMALIEEEERVTGGVAWATYWRYGKALGGVPILLVLLVVGVLAESSDVGMRIFLGFWSGERIPGLSSAGYSGIYAGIGAIMVLLQGVRVLVHGFTGLRASMQLFDKAYLGLTYAPVEFFDRNPTGRIASRMSKDIDSIDATTVWAIYGVSWLFASLVGTFALVMYTYQLLGVVYVPLLVVFVILAKFYGRTSQEVKRIESIVRSSTYSAFAEQLAGVAVIRAFGKESDFVTRMRGAIDRQQSPAWLQLVLQRWLSIRLIGLGCILLFGIGAFGVGYRNTVNPATFGVVLTYSIQNVQNLAQLIRQYIFMEQSMNSVERVGHYGDLKPEGELTLPSDPPKEWPQHGHVAFKDVQLRYRADTPLVLKGLSFEVQPGEKCGIIGRTGAGKSTIAQALFHLVEICNGSITVDGHDIRSVGLKTLRSSLSCIPQDSLLCQGTLRDNLDPEGLFDDAQVHEALERCGLAVPPDASPADKLRLAKFKLEAMVDLDGENYSAGERQLVALARAVLKRSKIILLDEATSSVDAETDAQFQRTLRRELTGTVLTIAHRLSSIAFYDKILVLDAGRAIEFGEPLALYDAGGAFRGLCDAAQLSREQIARARTAPL